MIHLYYTTTQHPLQATTAVEKKVMTFKIIIEALSNTTVTFIYLFIFYNVSSKTFQVTGMDTRKK